MNSRYRIYAAGGLVGALVLVGGFLVLGRGHSSTTAAPVIKPLHPLDKASRSARKATGKHAVKAARRPKVKAKAKVRVALAPPATAKTKPSDGMPAALSDALTHHTVVVLSLVAPGANVDELAYREAEAGAKEGHAGFVRISVADNAEVQALSILVGSSAEPGDRLFDAPAVFVFRKPGQLFVRFNGFVDADTVAQAATNAAQTG